jgi:hypothetical protein
MSQSVSLVAGNTTPPLSVTLSNADGPQDLSGASVAARLVNASTGAVVVLACVILSALAGQIVVAPPVTGWPLGIHYIEYDVTYGSGAFQTFPNVASDRSLLLVRAMET